MRLFVLLLIAATFVMGIFDDGNIGAAVIVAMLFLPAVFNRKKDGEEI